ncbi:MAG TPA: peptidylprolyl isomerase [Gemmatimonadaceae bacterium]|nr:peptidylprolyl isomerase [Gemmatimonadaceae bacterium]
MRHSLMMFAAATVLATPLLAQQAAENDRGGSPPVDGVVAVVGTTPILRSDVEERLAQARAAGQKMPTDSASQQAMLRSILDAIIDEELLVQKAKEEKVEVSDNDVNADVDKRMQTIRTRFTTEKEFRDELKKSGFGTVDEFRRWLMDQSRRSQLQQKLFEKLRSDGKITPAAVSNAEVDEFFSKNSSQLQKLPATVTLRQIVVAPKPTPHQDSVAFAKAESLYVEISKGGDFEQIAKRESMDPSTKELGGDLGWRRRGDFVPEFDRVYFALRPGVVSPPIKTVFGYHLIRVDRVQPAEVKGRHILIRPAIDSADIAAARAEAADVAKQWRAGVPFDTLRVKHHDPSEESSIPQPFPQSQLPQEYQTAIAGHKANDILDPFVIQDKTRGTPKFFVVQITSIAGEHEPTVADWRDKIRDQLAEEKAIRRYLDGLRKESYVSVRL